MELINQVIVQKYHIGYHVAKEKKLSDTIRKLTNRTPHQLFIGSPKGYTINISETDVNETIEIIKKEGLKLYIHTSYVINLSNSNELGVECLKNSLIYGSKMGFLGVVVHVGKAVKLTKPVAIELMRANISKALEVATERCPLLLETPAGQGTELLTDREEFIEFVKSFNSEKIKICVDTCHVFASGYENPIEYIKKAGELVKLIHFNDSKGACRSCVDRHAFIGTGLIGRDKLEVVAKWGEKHSIPMVIE